MNIKNKIRIKMSESLIEKLGKQVDINYDNNLNTPNDDNLTSTNFSKSQNAQKAISNLSLPIPNENILNTKSKKGIENPVNAQLYEASSQKLDNTNQFVTPPKVALRRCERLKYKLQNEPEKYYQENINEKKKQILSGKKIKEIKKKKKINNKDFNSSLNAYLNPSKKTYKKASIKKSKKKFVKMNKKTRPIRKYFSRANKLAAEVGKENINNNFSKITDLLNSLLLKVNKLETINKNLIKAEQKNHNIGSGKKNVRKIRTKSTKKFSAEELYQLKAEIQILTLNQQKGLFEILKKYHKVKNDTSEINFNLEKLPFNALQEIKVYTSKCLNEQYDKINNEKNKEDKKLSECIESLPHNLQLQVITPKKVFCEKLNYSKKAKEFFTEKKLFNVMDRKPEEKTFLKQKRTREPCVLDETNGISSTSLCK